MANQKPSATRRTLKNFRKHLFLFEELVKRDFQQRYKGTMLGIFWSVLSPVLMLLVMKMVFTNFFGRDTPHYTTYIFAGNIVMAFFREATKSGMNSLRLNASIINKINVPKYLFIFSKNVSALVNFLLTVGIFFVFAAFDRIRFGFHMLALVYPILCLILLNLGIGMIMSCLYIFFRDMTYLYDVFLRLLQYMSAIFYTVDRFGPRAQKFFLFNPVYVIIKYIRYVVIDGKIPSLAYHGLCAFYAVIFLVIGFAMYKKYNHQFIYYL